MHLNHAYAHLNQPRIFSRLLWLLHGMVLCGCHRSRVYSQFQTHLRTRTFRKDMLKLD